MSNPAFNRSPVFNGTRQAAAPQSTIDASTLQSMYAAPSATPVQAGRMTYDDVIVRTAGLLGIILAVGAATWVLAPQLALVGMIGALVFGLVNAFRREPSVPLILLYAVFEGMLLGGISKFFESAYNGIVLQAIAGTVGVFVAMLLAFRSGKVRASSKGVRFALIAMGGYLVFSLINMALIWSGAMDGWGLRSIEVAGVPIGIFISIFAVLLAAYSFVIDFDAVQRGVESGAPARYAWSGAFGLVVTLVWLYLELLRLLSYLRD
ncbi:MAG: Bax inhibitor-1/YccA family protein [Bifidobacteriaceae bacterium]|jgi:uncharacterized YccA/Bax inhibitor family protein|nr:Bax inhibitor-1/YccA family protein [Bifidobacteriaceae bacterium]